MLKCSSRIGVLLLCAGHAINDYYQSFLPVLIPILIAKFGISLTLSGMLVMANAFAANILQPLFGYFFDKHNNSKYILLMIAFCGITICCINYATTPFLMFVTVIALGLTVSSFHPLGSSLVRKIVSERNLGKAMSYYVAGGNFGCAIAPIAVVWFLEQFGLDSFIFMAIPAVLLALIYWLTGIHTLPSVQDGISTKEMPPVSSILKNKHILKLNFAMGMRCWTLTAISTFLPLLMQTSGYSNITSGWMLTLFLMGFASGGLAGGALGDRLGHKRIMTYTPLMAVLPIYYFFTNPSTEILSVIALVLGGAFMQAGQPSSMVWATRLMPQFVGVASGMMLGISYGLGSMGTAITAAVGEQIGLLPALILTIIPGVIAAFTVMTVPYTKE